MVCLFFNIQRSGLKYATSKIYVLESNRHTMSSDNRYEKPEIFIRRFLFLFDFKNNFY